MGGTSKKYKVNYIRVPVQWIDFEDIRGTADEGIFEFDVSQHDLEYLIFHLSPLEVELMVLKHMGFKPLEIVDLLGIKNVILYRRLARRLRRTSTKLMNNV